MTRFFYWLSRIAIGYYFILFVLEMFKINFPTYLAYKSAYIFPAVVLLLLFSTPQKSKAATIWTWIVALIFIAIMASVAIDRLGYGLQSEAGGLIVWAEVVMLPLFFVSLAVLLISERRAASQGEGAVILK